MLYRNPEPVDLPRFAGPLRRLLGRLVHARRRRLATLDLLALSDHSSATSG